jgi:hypothetical protein
MKATKKNPLTGIANSSRNRESELERCRPIKKVGNQN